MITQLELQSILNYDAKTGIFTRKVKRNFKQKIGEQCGTLHSSGYFHITINKRTYKAHRLAWLYVYGKWPNKMIDHINGNPNDNRICNLRECSNSQNQYNAKLRKDNTSGIKGVSWHKDAKKWAVHLNVNGKHKYIGIYETKELAESAIKEIRNEHHKQFSNHGDIQ
jgi:hypothetical protein